MQISKTEANVKFRQSETHAGYVHLNGIGNVDHAEVMNFLEGINDCPVLSGDILVRYDNGHGLKPLLKQDFDGLENLFLLEEEAMLMHKRIIAFREQNLWMVGSFPYGRSKMMRDAFDENADTWTGVYFYNAKGVRLNLYAMDTPLYSELFIKESDKQQFFNDYDIWRGIEI